MPFRSLKQRKYLWAKHPDIARKWTKEHGSKIMPHKGKYGGKKPTKKAKKVAKRKHK